MHVPIHDGLREAEAEAARGPPRSRWQPAVGRAVLRRRRVGPRAARLPVRLASQQALAQDHRGPAGDQALRRLDRRSGRRAEHAARPGAGRRSRDDPGHGHLSPEPQVGLRRALGLAGRGPGGRALVRRPGPRDRRRRRGRLRGDRRADDRALPEPSREERPRRRAAARDPRAQARPAHERLRRRGGRQRADLRRHGGRHAAGRGHLAGRRLLRQRHARRLARGGDPLGQPPLPPPGRGALRRQHRGQRPRPARPARRRSQRQRGVVQPARPRPRPPPHHEDRPQARRRLHVDREPRSLGRRLQRRPRARASSGSTTRSAWRGGRGSAADQPPGPTARPAASSGTSPPDGRDRGPCSRSGSAPRCARPGSPRPGSPAPGDRCSRRTAPRAGSA